jgi:serine/threonine protein kinase
MQKREQPPHYKDFKLIGNGAFGYVFKAIDSKTEVPVAIKRS